MLWRKLHFWIGLVLIVQFALWVVSGLGFALMPSDEMNGESERRPGPPPALSLGEVTLLPAAIQQALGSDARVCELRLVHHYVLSRPVYVIQVAGEDSPRVLDGQTGAPVPKVTEEEARRIAVSDFAGEGEITSVEWIDRMYQKAYDYYGELPAYRFNFSNWKNSRIYVTASTGEITARRNVAKGLFDFFWTVHVFGYMDRSVRGNVALIAAGAFSFLVVLSGGVLYLPYFRRRRLAREKALAR